MKNDSHCSSNKIGGSEKSTGYHPGPVAPPTANGVSLQIISKLQSPGPALLITNRSIHNEEGLNKVLHDLLNRKVHQSEID